MLGFGGALRALFPFLRAPVPSGRADDQQLINAHNSMMRRLGLGGVVPRPRPPIAPLGGVVDLTLDDDDDGDDDDEILGVQPRSSRSMRRTAVPIGALPNGGVVDLTLSDDDSAATNGARASLVASAAPTVSIEDTTDDDDNDDDDDDDDQVIEHGVAALPLLVPDDDNRPRAPPWRPPR